MLFINNFDFYKLFITRARNPTDRIGWIGADDDRIGFPAYRIDPTRSTGPIRSDPENSFGFRMGSDRKIFLTKMIKTTRVKEYYYICMYKLECIQTDRLITLQSIFFQLHIF